jgi:hypothetical protein
METVTTYRRGILCAIVSTKADYQPSIAAKNKDLPNPYNRKPMRILPPRLNTKRLLLRVGAFFWFQENKYNLCGIFRFIAAPKSKSFAYKYTYGLRPH